MDGTLSRLLGLVSAETLVRFAAVSLAVFVGTLVAIPIILIRLPSDYFDIRVPRLWMRDQHPALRFIGLLVKNVAGVLFLLAGVAMLILPGQGVLTMLIGISLLDFPGKQTLEARIVSQSIVLNAINSLRGRFGKPPLVIAPNRSG